MAKQSKSRRSAADQKFDEQLEEIEHRFREFGIEDPGVESALIEMRRQLELIASGVGDVLAGQREIKKLLRDRDTPAASADNAPQRKKSNKKRRKSS